MRRMNAVMIALVSVIAAVVAAVSCERQYPQSGHDGPDNPGDSSAVTPGDTLPSLGIYVFGTDTCDIYVLEAEESGSYRYLVMSPLRPGENMSTYVVFGLRKYWCDGEVHDVNDPLNPLDHNDDYYFVYEDPVHYYSQYRAFQEGTIQMSVSEDGLTSLALDVLLIDGTPFSIRISQAAVPPADTVD